MLIKHYLYIIIITIKLRTMKNLSTYKAEYKRAKTQNLNKEYNSKIEAYIFESDNDSDIDKLPTEKDVLKARENDIQMDFPFFFGR